MKVIILAGGKGSRISYYTQKIPKPMVKIGGSPLLSHIMRLFKHYGFDDFINDEGYPEEAAKFAVVVDEAVAIIDATATTLGEQVASS